MSLFVDTSIWYAAVDESDLDNQSARRVLSSGGDLVTTDHILVETWLLLCNRIGRSAADQFWDKLRSVCSIELVGLADLDAAWQIGQQWRDQGFSIVDRTSFAVMLRLGIDRAASLDRHFAIFRFGARRRYALTILR